MSDSALVRSGATAMLHTPLGLTTKEHTYLAGMRPYVGNPEDLGRLMAKHPLSYTRNGAALGPEISMKDVWRMRKTGNSVLPKGDSLTHEPEAATEKATEFASQFSLQGMKTKHSRSPCSPLHKYK